MSQNIFFNASIKVAPTLSPDSIGNGTLTVNRLSHFTISQSYTVVCTAIDPFTVFNVVGSLDGAVGVAVVGQEFHDEDMKVFLTIQQGPTLFEIGDMFTFEVQQGTDVNQQNLDLFDELPQKNFGPGIVGSLKGDHNIRFNSSLNPASLVLQDLQFTSIVPGPIGNLISIKYIEGSYLKAASKIIQDLKYEATSPGEIGNLIQIQYLDWIEGVAASKTIQGITYTADAIGVAGNSISITYVGGATAGSEYATISGTDITVHIADGVSTPDQIRFALFTNTTIANLIGAVSLNTDPQTIQPKTYFEGGSNPIGDAGNEVVQVIGNLIKVRFQSGVSTAQQVYTALVNSPSALALITPTITGVANTVQISPIGPLNLENGTEDVGTPGNEIVEVNDKDIIVTFISGASTATQIKSKIDSSVAASALISVTITGTGSNPQASGVSETFLKNGTEAGSYAFNKNELTQPGDFREGNAGILVTGIHNQGNEVTEGDSEKYGKLKLHDQTGESGNEVVNVQKTINNLIQNGKVILFTSNNEAVKWSKPAGTLTAFGDIKILFTESGIINTILMSNFPMNLLDGEHVWVAVNRTINSNLVLTKSTSVPTGPDGENIFRLFSRIGDAIVWWDNTLQREGKKIRIGEGGGGGVAWQEKLGLGNGIQKTFPIPSGFIPSSAESILVFSNVHHFITEDWTYDLNSNSIVFVNAPELGIEPYIYFLTDGETLEPPSAEGLENSFIHTLSITDVMNKQFQLPNTPFRPSAVLVDVLYGGGSMHYGTDYSIDVNIFIWENYDLDGLLEVGDKIRFYYYS